MARSGTRDCIIIAERPSVHVFRHAFVFEPDLRCDLPETLFVVSSALSQCRATLTRNDAICDTWTEVCHHGGQAEPGECAWFSTLSSSADVMLGARRQLHEHRCSKPADTRVSSSSQRIIRRPRLGPCIAVVATWRPLPLRRREQRPDAISLLLRFARNMDIGPARDLPTARIPSPHDHVPGLFRPAAQTVVQDRLPVSFKVCKRHGSRPNSPHAKGANHCQDVVAASARQAVVH